MTLAAKAAR